MFISKHENEVDVVVIEAALQFACIKKLKVKSPYFVQSLLLHPLTVKLYVPSKVLSIDAGNLMAMEAV